MSPQKNILRVGQTDFLGGTVKAPPSKSYTHRAVLIASLDGKSRIVNPLECEDTRHTIGLCKKLGARIQKDGNGLVVTGFSGRPRPKGKALDAGEAGTLLRFILSILPLASKPVTIRGKGSLLSRPNGQVVSALQSWGVDIKGRGQAHKLPIHINANGRLKGGPVRVEAGVTSQVVSSLLIAAPFADEDTVLRLSGRLVSRPYVDITIDVLKWAGIRVERTGYKIFRVKSGKKFLPRSNFTVHGDYSSASFLLAAGCLLESDVTVTDLVKDSQGDRAILRILRAMGADLRIKGSAVTVKGPASLRGISLDGSDIPDLVPVLTMLSCFAKGVTRIRNVSHLVHKESNRLAKPAGELKKLGARISFTKDELVIRPAKLHGGRVSSCNDHRIAMALAVAGLKVPGGVTISGPGCIAKSYPRFVADMKSIGANLA